MAPQEGPAHVQLPQLRGGRGEAGGVAPHSCPVAGLTAQLGESEDKVCGAVLGHHIPGDVTHPGRLPTSRAACPSAGARRWHAAAHISQHSTAAPSCPPAPAPRAGGSGEGGGISSLWDSHKNRPSSWPSSPKSFTPESSYSPWTLQGPGVLWMGVPFEEREARSGGGKWSWLSLQASGGRLLSLGFLCLRLQDVGGGGARSLRWVL